MNEKLKARELLDKVATRAGLPQTQANLVLKALGEVVPEELKKGVGLTLPGIGSLSTSYRHPRNHKVFGKEVATPGKMVPIIRWTRRLKEELANQSSSG